MKISVSLNWAKGCNPTGKRQLQEEGSEGLSISLLHVKRKEALIHVVWWARVSQSVPVASESDRSHL